MEMPASLMLSLEGHGSASVVSLFARSEKAGAEREQFWNATPGREMRRGPQTGRFGIKLGGRHQKQPGKIPGQKTGKRTYTKQTTAESIPATISQGWCPGEWESLQ